MTADRVRVGVIGCGNVAVNLHLPGYRANKERFEVVGVADPTPARLEAARAADGAWTCRAIPLAPSAPVFAEGVMGLRELVAGSSPAAGDGVSADAGLEA